MTDRLYGMDFLRMALMLSGLVFHAGLFYTCTELEAIWPFQEAKCHLAFDVLCGCLHLFRIPAFMAIAGFFSALLFERRGIIGIIINRFWRIIVPFLLGWIILFPVVMLTIYYITHLGDENILNETFKGLFSSTLIEFKPKITIHLWFLYYLMFFYIALIFIRVLWKPRRQKSISLVLGVGIILSAIGFYYCDSGEFNGFYSFKPDFFSLLGFAAFFFFGYVLYYNQQWINCFKKIYLLLFMLSIAPLGAYLLLRKGEFNLGDHLSKILMILSSVIFSWMMIIALIGWVSDKFKRQNALIRYLSDASYWIYLIHLPVVLLIGGLLNDLIHISFLAWVLNILATSFLTILSYHFLVRSTIIGKLLNGRKYPFVSPFKFYQE